MRCRALSCARGRRAGGANRALAVVCRESYEAKDLPEELDLAEEYSKVIDALNPCVDLFIAETLVSRDGVRTGC